MVAEPLDVDRLRQAMLRQGLGWTDLDLDAAARDIAAEYDLISAPDTGAEERLRAALKDAVRLLSGGRQGYVGDHYIREIQVKQTTVDRLRAVLSGGSVDEEEPHESD